MKRYKAPQDLNKMAYTDAIQREIDKEKQEIADNKIAPWVYGVTIATVALGLFVGSCHAETINVDKIIRIESSGRSHVISQDGFSSIGLMQVSPCVLKEYNQYKKTNYTTKDLFNKEINVKIGTWYLTKRIPQMLRHYKTPVTTDNIIIAYNAGIKNAVSGRVPRITKAYLKKYRGQS